MDRGTPSAKGSTLPAAHREARDCMASARAVGLLCPGLKVVAEAAAAASLLLAPLLLSREARDLASWEVGSSPEGGMRDRASKAEICACERGASPPPPPPEDDPSPSPPCPPREGADREAATLGICMGEKAVRKAC